MSYREHLPSRDLAPWIECFWTRDGAGPAAGASHRVLPDGCADVLFDLKAARAPGALVVGPMTTALLVPSREDERYLGVRFRPGGAGAFLRVPLSTLVDRRLELRALWRDAAEVCDRMVEANEGGRALEALERELRARLVRGPALAPRVAGLVELVGGATESVSVATLAERAGITRQHLTRLFQREVGYGPKKLSRILRLRRAVRLLEDRGRDPLSIVALDAGYYDQSHMNADFRELAGGPPLSLVAASAEVPFLQDTRTARRAHSSLDERRRRAIVPGRRGQAREAR